MMVGCVCLLAILVPMVMVVWSIVSNAPGDPLHRHAHAHPLHGGFPRVFLVQLRCVLFFLDGFFDQSVVCGAGTAFSKGHKILIDAYFLSCWQDLPLDKDRPLQETARDLMDLQPAIHLLGSARSVPRGPGSMLLSSEYTGSLSHSVLNAIRFGFRWQVIASRPKT